LRLLAGTAAVEGGALDTVVPITSRDEIGRLTQSFNSMVGELRIKAQIRETFGKYVDPRILANRQSPTAPGQSGQRAAGKPASRRRTGRTRPRVTAAATMRPFRSGLSAPVRARSPRLARVRGSAGKWPVSHLAAGSVDLAVEIVAQLVQLGEVLSSRWLVVGPGGGQQLGEDRLVALPRLPARTRL
jgi:hypothetical protein